MYIYKRKDNRYEGRYENPFSHSKSGKSSVYGKTYSEVRQKLIKAQTEIANKNVFVQPTRLKRSTTAFLKNWLENDIMIGVKDSTYNTYLDYLEKHIAPYFQNSELRDLNRHSIQTFCNYLYREGRLDKTGGLSASTVKDIYGFLSRAFSQAVKDSFLKANPCEDVKLPNARNELEILSLYEQQQLVAYLNVNGHPNNVGIYLGLYAGLRIGEICGLRWGDIDLNTGQIVIQRSIRRTANRQGSGNKKTQVKIDTPKSSHSSRRFYLPDDLLVYLAVYKKELSDEEKGDGCYLLKGRNGKYLDPRTLYAYYKKILKRAKLPEYTFHALRHTFATRSQERGMDMSTLSQILGHKDSAFTLRRYGHATEENKRIQINKLNDGMIVPSSKSIA